MKPEELYTERLVLRRVKEGDAENLFCYTKDPECSRFLTRSPHRHIDQTKQFLNSWASWEKESNNFCWVVGMASNDEAIGIFIANIDGHKAEVHFGIRREFWRQGFTTEFIQAASDWLMSEGKLQRIWAVCDLENIGSIKTLENSGFKKEGTLQGWLVLPSFGETARDCYVYARV